MLREYLKNYKVILASGSPRRQQFFRDLDLDFEIRLKEVEEIYLKSKIYWHATGFDEDENYQPVRFEHFGIAPIEAISAGCIPILFKGGGLPEIINQLNLDNSAYLFDSVDSLVSLTIRQMNNEKMHNWKEIFKILNENYSQKVFKGKFLKLVSRS